MNQSDIRGLPLTNQGRVFFGVRTCGKTAGKIADKPHGLAAHATGWQG
jgi:hypothetical protein